MAINPCQLELAHNDNYAAHSLCRAHVLTVGYVYGFEWRLDARSPAHQLPIASQIMKQKLDLPCPPSLSSLSGVSALLQDLSPAPAASVLPGMDAKLLDEKAPSLLVRPWLCV